MILTSNTSQQPTSGTEQPPPEFLVVRVARSLNHRVHFIVCTIAATILLAATIALFFVHLGSSSISLASDEVIYVRMTQGIVQTGELFPLRHGSAASFEKPPLKFWLSAIVPALFGESNWTYRLFDGALGALAIALSTLLSYKLSRSLPAALAVGVLLLGAPEWVISQHGFRRVVLDGLLTVLTLLSALYSWKWCSRAPSTRNAIAIGALCSLAILTKSVAGFVPLLCALLTLILCGERRPSVGKLLVVTMIPLATFVAYVGCVWLIGGWKGLNSFLGVEIFTRALSGFEGHNSDKPLFYVWYLFHRAAVVPHTLLIAGLIGALMSLRGNREFRFLALWGVVPVIAYSCSTSKAPWYLSPFMPFMCMIAVMGTSSLMRALSTVPISRVGAVPLAALLVITTALPYSRAFTRALAEVLSDTQRIPLDLMSETLIRDFQNITLENGAISGRTSPIRGRFNVEGIYREMMKPKLTIIQNAAEAPKAPATVTLIRESSLKELPPGWLEVGRIPPFGARVWWLVAVTYPATSLPETDRNGLK